MHVAVVCAACALCVYYCQCVVDLCILLFHVVCVSVSYTRVFPLCNFQTCNWHQSVYWHYRGLLTLLSLLVTESTGSTGSTGPFCTLKNKRVVILQRLSVCCNTDALPRVWLLRAHAIYVFNSQQHIFLLPPSLSVSSNTREGLCHP